MTTLGEKFTKLVELLDNHNLAWARHSGVPFIICPYEKKEYMELFQIIERLKQYIQNFHLEVVNMEEVIFKIIEENETIDGIIELEKNEADINLVEELKELLLEEIRDYFVSKAKEIGPNGRLIVTRIGATAIYFNFIRLLSYLEGRVQIPVVFFYPGTYDRYSVNLLGQYKETALRALIL
jgi:hypothetical protein